jgi:hypothetical protein
MQQHPQAPVGRQPNAEGFAAMAHAPLVTPDGRQINGYPHAGAQAAGTIQETHVNLARAMQVQGQLNK